MQFLQTFKFSKVMEICRLLITELNDDYDLIEGEIRMEVLFNSCDVVSTIRVHRHSNCRILHSERLKVGIDIDRL